jgi:Domain of unknown function (DUF5658)
MRYLLYVMLLGASMQAQSFTANNSFSVPAASTAPQFWTIENRINVGILAGLIAADAITTQRGLSEGYREANPLMRPFVTRGVLGEAAGSGLGFGTAVGAAYLLHRTHHYKAERLTMRLMIAGEGGFVANNILVLR